MSSEGENHSVEICAASSPMTSVSIVNVTSRLRSRAKEPLLRNRTADTRNGTRTRIARSRGGISGAGRELMMRLTVSLWHPFGQPT